jgi:hypothetical protein
LSLKGAADFHSLEYRHGIVYGLNSGTRTVMVSADKQTWDRRSAIKAIDIVIAPQDAKRYWLPPPIVAATMRQAGPPYDS